MYIQFAKGRKVYIVSAEKRDTLVGYVLYYDVFYIKPKFKELYSVYKNGYRNFDIRVYELS